MDDWWYNFAKKTVISMEHPYNNNKWCTKNPHSHHFQIFFKVRDLAINFSADGVRVAIQFVNIFSQILGCSYTACGKLIYCML